MGIFSRFGRISENVVGRLFGRKERADIEQSEYARQKAKTAAEAAKLKAQRAAQAEKDALAAARQARLRREQADREAARTRTQRGSRHHVIDAAERARKQAQRDEQEALTQAARARAEQMRQERLARDAQRAAEQELIRVEGLRAKAREALLRTRANMSDEDFAAAFRGPRPERREYANEKTGEGDLPDKKEFLNRGVPYSAFASSNVEALQFDPLTGDLYVQYLKKHLWYRSRGVGRKVAELGYIAASKGVFSWDNLRVRGTRKGNRFRTDKDSPPPAYLPLENETSGGQFGAAGGF